MDKNFYINKFYFQSARYKLTSKSKAEIYLNLDYENNSFSIEEVNGQVSHVFIKKAEYFAKILLKKKSRVNNVAILKEKYSKIFQS